jgi:stress response protein YsnF
MTLSEEELVINTELVESGRARLIKRVEVETVTRTIELRREVLEIERLDPTPQHGATAPPDAGAAGSSDVLETGPLATGSLQEGSLEIVLMQEEALITTQMVPRERVRLTKHVVAEGQPIEVDLRTERVDLEQRTPPRDGKAPD